MRAACGFFLISLLSSVDAVAADYSVSYAFDVGGVRDWGKVACEYKSPCKIDSRPLKLSIALSFANPNHRDVTIGISGEEEEGRLGCCYFPDGVDEVIRNVRDLPIRLYVYAGQRPSKNEFPLREPLGILYLQLLDVK